MALNSRQAVIGAVVLVVLGVAAYAGWRAVRDDDEDPPAKPDLTAELEATGLTLYEIRLRDAVPDKLKVRDGRVEINYTEDGSYAWSTSLAPAPKGNLCVVLEVDPAGHCEYADGVMRYTFEEMSDAAVVRGDTLLRIGALVTEVDPELLDEAVTALQEAPVVSPEELAGSGRG
ncbi:hypothetical protein [Nocardioides speluncae]|uniref:hypothetical protein n=1 Tax=Nocardioides speluncae TaxID=2670337 RepID=UPI0012B16D42|nr:hypothetical protein [Nocardioides speluncae]